MTEHLHKQTLDPLIDTLRPGHGQITWMDGGDNREIAVLEAREAFRFAIDTNGHEVNRYEFAALQLLQGKLDIQIPKPIELAKDGSYNVLSFLHGKVLTKHEMSALPLRTRCELGVGIINVINQLNTNVSRDELSAIPSSRPLMRFRNGYFKAIYIGVEHDPSDNAKLYREHFERLKQLRPDGPKDNIIVFGDFTSPNMVLTEDNVFDGLIDWTELGFGDVHNELRPVFSVLGAEAFSEAVKKLHPSLGPINHDLVRQCAIVHELSVVVSGKQRGLLTPERERLAIDSVHEWLA